MNEPVFCDYCLDDIKRPELAEKCCGVLFHHPCYIAHRDEQSAAEINGTCC